MKKLLFIAVITIAGLGKVNAQTSFGAIGGYHNLSVKAKGGGISASVDGSGFFAGLFAEFKISETFKVQPEFQFTTATNDGDAAELLLLPIMAKYYIEGKFNLQAGPQFDYSLNDEEFGVGLGFGAGYDFSENFFASARYVVGLTNKLDDAPSGVSVTLNTLQVGIGYRF